MRHLAIVGLGIALVGCVTAANPPRVCVERRVYIGSFGTAEEAAQFAIVLEEELRGEGFSVVGRPEDADLILSGVVTITYVSGLGTQPTVVARATSTRSRESLWTDSYESRKKPESLKSRADDVAEDLRDACRKGWRKG